ncbi:MAG: BspA family leucine-rich repeat surface protein [Bdellovibrionota bacterium]
MKTTKRKQQKWIALLLLPYLALMMACGGDGTKNQEEVTVDPVVPTTPESPTFEPTPFISKWQIDSAGQSITLPLRSGYNYDFKVDWGDGSPIAKITSATDIDITHVYTQAGVYEVRIKGLLESWYFNDSGDTGALIEVVDLGHAGWKRLDFAFAGCYNLVSFAGGNTSGVTNMQGMFYKTIQLASVDVSSFDTSKVTDMSHMFDMGSGASALTTLDVSHFDTSKVTSMREMFDGLSVLTALDLSNFDTSKVTSMRGMFSYTYTLTTLDLSSFDTSKVIDMQFMFESAYSLSSLDVSSFNTSKVEYMDNMFYGLDAITSLDLSHFDTSKVEYMDMMFTDTYNLSSLNTYGWDVSNVVSSYHIFSGAGNNVIGGLTLYCNQPLGYGGISYLFGKQCSTL